MNIQQKFLLKFSKKNVISLDDLEKDSSSDDENLNRACVKKFKEEASKNKTLKDDEFLDATLKQYLTKKKIRVMDKKILLGLVSKHPAKYIEKAIDEGHSLTKIMQDRDGSLMKS